MNNQVENFCNAIPNLNKIFIKSWNKLRLIRIIVDLIIPWTIFSIIEWVFKVDIIYIALIYLLFSNIYALMGMYSYFEILYKWNTKYKKIILPLYKNNKNEMLIKYMSDSGFLFRDNINWQKLNFKDIMSVVYKLKNPRNKYWWISLLPLFEVGMYKMINRKVLSSLLFGQIVKTKFSKEYNIEVTSWYWLSISNFEDEARNQVNNL
ncbi:MAG: hypothetical protein HRT98_03350 [Mycoplasmatales bacterium]|nr:hypothetical protein [Mycoplasmatales bacterium]